MTTTRLRKLFLLALLLLAPGIRAAPAEIRVAEQYGLAFLPLMVMRDQRLVEKYAAKGGLANLRITWSKPGGINAINDALLSGPRDIAAGGVPSLVTLWAKTRGTPGAVRGVAALGDVPNELVVSRPEVNSIRDFGRLRQDRGHRREDSNQALAMAAAREFRRVGLGEARPAHRRDGPPGCGHRAPLRQRRDHRSLLLSPFMERDSGNGLWWRPALQAPESVEGRAVALKQAQVTMLEEIQAEETAGVGPVPWPKGLGGQMVAVRAVLQRGTARGAREVAQGFAGKATKERVEAVADVLDALRALGQAVSVDGGAEKRWAGTGQP